MCISQILIDLVINSLGTGMLSMIIFLALYLLSFSKKLNSHYLRTAFLSFLIISAILIVFGISAYSLYSGKICQ